MSMIKYKLILNCLRKPFSNQPQSLSGLNNPIESPMVSSPFAPDQFSADIRKKGVDEELVIDHTSLGFYLE